MKVHKDERQATRYRVEYTADEEQAVTVARAVSARDVIARFGGEAGIVFSPDDKQTILLALDMLIEATGRVAAAKEQLQP